MALYVGEAVRIRALAVDPETDQPLDPPPLQAFVEFWGPGRNPVRDESVRDSPDIDDQLMTYRAETNDFILFQLTEGDPWEPGKWTYRVTIVGSTYRNWEYGTFSLKR